MTLPIERTNAVLNTEAFLIDLLDPKKTPRVPKGIRQRAASCLRHYPSCYNMANIKESFEEVVQVGPKYD
jgi:hypothetical protein